MKDNNTTTQPDLTDSLPLSPVFIEPSCFRVKYDLSNEFVQKVKSEGLKIEKVIEILNCNILEYWINCPKEKENIISDYAFMTWIKNPVFQKYYSESKAFELIAAKYIIEKQPENIEKDIEIERLINANNKLRNALILGLYHDGWAEENGLPKKINNPELGAPKWVVIGFAALS